MNEGKERHGILLTEVKRWSCFIKCFCVVWECCAKRESGLKFMSRVQSIIKGTQVGKTSTKQIEVLFVYQVALEGLVIAVLQIHLLHSGKCPGSLWSVWLRWDLVLSFPFSPFSDSWVFSLFPQSMFHLFFSQSL